MSEAIILVGGGGHCRSVMDVIEAEGRFQVAGIVDRPERVGERVLGVEIIASDADLAELVREYPYFLVTLGQVKSPAGRIAAYERLQRLGARLPVVVSPLARLSPHAQAGAGTVVMHHSLVNAGAVVGVNCIINNHSLVEHDAQVGDHCHVSTGAVLNGGAMLGEGGFLGSGAHVRQGVRIGTGAVIGLGARVLADVPDNATFY